MSDDLPQPAPPRGPPARRGRSTAWRAVQAQSIVAIVLFLARYLRHAWPAVDAYHWRLRPGLLAVSAVLVLVFYVLSALVWWLILRGSGLRPEPTLTVATWGKSILARYLPGNVFMFVSRGWMSYRQGLDVDRVSAGMVYEQALNVAAALVVTAALFPFWRYERRVTAWALLAIPVIVAALHPRVFAPLAALAFADAAPAAPHAGPFAAGRARPARRVRGSLAPGRPCSVDVRGGGHGRDRRHLLPITAGYAVAFVVGMVVFFVPSGIGVREGVLAAATASVFAGGGVALAWALLARLWQTALEIGFVGAAALAERLHRRAAQAHSTEIAGDQCGRQAAAPARGRRRMNPRPAAR